jgi:hypothetical protein
MHAAYKLIANMGTMGLLQQFGPTPNPAALKEPLEGQRQQIIEVAHVDNPEKESSSADDDDVVEDEEMEEESATDDEDYIEECDETSKFFSEVKERRLVSYNFIEYNFFYVTFFHNCINSFLPLSNRQQ